VKSIRIYIVLSGIVFLSTAPLYGQDEELIVTTERDLVFGTLLSGIGQIRTIELADQETAFFQISGPRRADIYISFLLPASLMRIDGSGSIPLSFNETSAGWSRRVDQVPPGGNQFHPAVGTSAAFNPGNRIVYVRLGGIITTEPQQPAGQYMSTVTIVVDRTDL
jgi:hypothetical protein